MQSFEDIRAVNAAGPDFAGFIFAKERKRYVEPKFAKEMKLALDPEISAVGVFVDEDPKTTAKIAEDGIIDMLQLHGNEDEEYIEKLRQLTGKPIIKAFTIRSDEDIRKAIRSSADYVLLDNGKGTGSKFDWNYVHDFPRSFFLAGGLDPENVRNAINVMHPFAVDVSSGVEYDDLPSDRSKGTKDPAKIRKFIEEAKK